MSWVFSFIISAYNLSFIGMHEITIQLNMNDSAESISETVLSFIRNLAPTRAKEKEIIDHLLYDALERLEHMEQQDNLEKEF